MEAIKKNRDKIKGRSIHVLLVDDNRNITVVNKMVFEEMGYTVYSANSGTEAVALIEQYHDVIDVIITDYSIPGMNGIDLALEARRYMADTPVILYTGKAEFIDKKKITEAGITEVIVKPFKVKDLDIIIRDILKR